MDIKFLILMLFTCLGFLLIIRYIKECFLILTKHVTESFKLNGKHQTDLTNLLAKEIMMNSYQKEAKQTGVDISEQPIEVQKKITRTEEQKKAASEKRRQWWAEKKAREANQPLDQIPPSV